MMSSSCLEADLNAFASTIRARLRRHRLHQSKVHVYRWWDTILNKLRTAVQARLGLDPKVIGIAGSSVCCLSAMASGLGREWPFKGMASVRESVNAIVTCVGR